MISQCFGIHARLRFTSLRLIFFPAVTWLWATTGLARPDLTNCIPNDLFPHWAKKKSAFSSLPDNCD